jgi:hypothetical protein
MSNSISGRVIAVSKLQSVASSDASKQPVSKREIFIDCTRYDPYTGQRSQYENKMVLEFVGKVLEKVNPVLDQAQPNDIVIISFELQGRSYQEKGTNKTKYMTQPRCFDIAITRKADGGQGQQFFPNSSPQPNPQTQQQVQQVQQVAQALNAEPVQGDNGLPF